MNYFAHAWVARRIDPDPRFVLGAMLPDLAGFLRLRLPAQPDPWVSRGIALHHRTDAAFHALPGFHERNVRGSRALQSRGLGRGPARAAAHVGIELVLDGLLAAACPDSVLAFGAALAESERIVTSRPADTRAITRMAARLAGFDPAGAVGSTQQVADRVRRTLEHRPLLALGPHDLCPLEDWLGETESELSSHAEPLAAETLHAAR